MKPAVDSILTVQERGLPTDRRLLLAAERLYARHGIDAVSLRMVMSAAGANVASVNYHFGSKTGLVTALLRDRAGEMHRRRLALLEELEAGGDRGLTVESLAGVLVEPLVELVRAGAGDWVTVLAQLMSHGPVSAELAEVFEGQQRDWDRVYRAVRPSLSTATRAFRLAQALRMACQALGEAGPLAEWMASIEEGYTVERVYEDVVAVAAGMLGAH